MLRILRPRNIIILIILFFVVCNYTHKYTYGLVESSISKNLGVPVYLSGLNYLNLFKGEIVFDEFTIMSPGHTDWLNKRKDIDFNRVVIKPDWISLFKNDRIIKDIRIQTLRFQSINNNKGENNIANLIYKMATTIGTVRVFEHADKSLIVKKMLIENVFISTTLSTGKTSNSHIKNIKFENLGGKNYTIYEIVYRIVTNSFSEAFTSFDSGKGFIYNLFGITGTILGTAGSIIDSADKIVDGVTKPYNK